MPAQARKHLLHISIFLPDWWRKEDPACQSRHQWSSIWASSRRDAQRQRWWGRAPWLWQACRRPPPCCPHPADWTSPRSSHYGKFLSATVLLVPPFHLRGKRKRETWILFWVWNTLGQWFFKGRHNIQANTLILQFMRQTFTVTVEILLTVLYINLKLSCKSYIQRIWSTCILYIVCNIAYLI